MQANPSFQIESIPASNEAFMYHRVKGKAAGRESNTTVGIGTRSLALLRE
jgi:hypothetical protein